jgi:hypothetical protein
VVDVVAVLAGRGKLYVTVHDMYDGEGGDGAGDRDSGEGMTRT